jgi:hypothetical protein
MSSVMFSQATFEAFIGIRDDKATAQLKLFGDNLQVLSHFICKVGTCFSWDFSFYIHDF